jgi:carboxymethylenebutenolidase
MKKIALLLALVASSLPAQDWAQARVAKSPRHREWVTLKHDGRSVESFVAYPESKDKTPVVIVIHEIFGHADWVQLLTDELAEAGYIAISPDLLSGLGAERRAHHVVSGGWCQRSNRQASARPGHGRSECRRGVRQKLPASNGKIYVAGFCYGGRRRSALRRIGRTSRGRSCSMAPPRRQPAAGRFTPDAAALGRIKAPVYGFYAGTTLAHASLPATVEAMKAAGKMYEPVTYEGAGHGFMRAGDDAAGNGPTRRRATMRGAVEDAVEEVACFRSGQAPPWVGARQRRSACATDGIEVTQGERDQGVGGLAFVRVDAAETAGPSGGDHYVLLSILTQIGDGNGERAPSSLVDHNSFPVRASNARKRASSVAAMNTSPPAVAIGPPRVGVPLLVRPS